MRTNNPLAILSAAHMQILSKKAKPERQRFSLLCYIRINELVKKLIRGTVTSTEIFASTTRELLCLMHFPRAKTRDTPVQYHR